VVDIYGFIANIIFFLIYCEYEEYQGLEYEEYQGLEYEEYQGALGILHIRNKAAIKPCSLYCEYKEYQGLLFECEQLLMWLT